MVRSPHPHARIATVDTAEAMAMPGVLGVFTGADVQTDGLRPIPYNPVPSTNYDVKLTGRGGTEVFIGPHYLLPADKTRHLGDAVAMVVADGTGEIAPISFVSWHAELSTTLERRIPTNRRCRMHPDPPVICL
jgi:aerobic carbon-monoxide dehydrogenase large subunit